MILVNLADLIADTICYCYASILMFARFLSFYLKKTKPAYYMFLISHQERSFTLRHRACKLGVSQYSQYWRLFLQSCEY